VLSGSDALLSHDRHSTPIRASARHHVTDLCDRQEFYSRSSHAAGRVLLAKNDADL
jgi:hypothetical protein